MRLKLKLLALAGLCAMLVAMSTQPVRACTNYWGFITMYFPTAQPGGGSSGSGSGGAGGYSYDTGCVYEGTVQDGFVCTAYQYPYGCYGGVVYYNCGCL